MTEYMKYKDAMTYLGIKSAVTLRKYIEQGLPVIKVGNSKRIKRSDIDDFMRTHKEAD